MAVEREVLVKLVHVEGLHVADDISAELRDVYVAEVDVLPAAVDETTAFVFQILLHPVVQICFGSSGWCRGAMGLPCGENIHCVHYSKYKTRETFHNNVKTHKLMHTCMFRVVVPISHPCQSSHPWFSFVHVMCQLCS